MTLESNEVLDTEVWFYFWERKIFCACEANDALDSDMYEMLIHKDNLIFPSNEPIDLGLYSYTLAADDRTLIKADHVEEAVPDD